MTRETHAPQDRRQNEEISDSVNNSIAHVEGNFIEDGFIIVRNAISAGLTLRLQQITNETLADACKTEYLATSDSRENDECFNKSIMSLIELESAFDVLKPVWKNFIHKDMMTKLFLEAPIFNAISDILGKDLCFQDAPSLNANIPGKADSKLNYLFKGYHQEVWSGASIYSLQFWSPIFQPNSSSGIAVVKGSHLWGHIPHRNREPVELPNNIQEIQTDLNIGDVIIFHTLLLHRSSPIPESGNPRLAITCLLKNFRFPNDSFECYRNWKIFSYSDLSHIDRRLGNHYLSPFRILDVPKQDFTGSTL